MRKIRSIISILLSIVLLLSSISVVSIVSFAEGNTLTKIENTFDDEGVEYTTISMDSLRGSIRTVNGVPDTDKFSVWGTTIENYSEDNNAVKFISADTAISSYPAVVKLYDNNTKDKAQFKPKANTSYSIKLRYMVTEACTDRDLIFQLRQVNNTKPDKYTYSEADILISNLVTVTKSTTTDGWVDVSAIFTTSSTPAYVYLNLHSTNYRKNFEVWVDDIVIEELYNVTVNNYTPNQNKTIRMAQGSTASDITIPTASGCRFDGIYADADYTVPLSPDAVLDSYAGGTIYFKWVKLTPQQYFCDFENYGSSVVSAYDKAVASLVSDTVYNGNMAMKAALKNKGITAFEIRTKDAFYITKGTQYEVSFAYKTDADAQISVGLAKATDICGSAVAYATTTVTANDSWQTATLTITADKGTSEAYALAMLIFAENGANVYFDDILVTDMSERDTVNMPTVHTDTYPTVGKAKEIWDGTIATKFAGGTGTQADPYLISNGKELALAITQSGAGELYYGKYYKITKDIYLNDINAVDWSSGAKNSGYTVHSWYDYFQNGTTIEGEDFAGVIDGAGFTVYGLYYKHGESIKSTANIKLASGLIPGTAEGFNSEVSNLGIDYAYVHHKFTAGIVVGTSQVSDNITVSNSYVGQNVKVSGNSAGAFVGAGADGKRNVTLTNCYSLASYATGVKNYGLAAYLYNTTATIKNCYNSNGPLTSYSYANWATTYNFYNSYETAESGTSNATTKKNVYQITAENMQGTDVFTNEEKMPYLALNTNGSANTAYTATEGYPVLTSFIKDTDKNSANESVAVWDGKLPEALEGDGNEASPYLIKNGGDLAYAITSGGGNDKYYKLTSDIYLNDATDFNLNTGYAYDSNLNQWYFDQAFAGTIDGDGHTVYGLYYRNENIPSKGFLSNLYGAGLVPKVALGATVTIKNLSIDKSYVANVYYASAFVGLSGENVSSSDKAVVNIENCYVGSQVKIEGYYAGAFLGGSRNGNITIANSYSLATTEGSTGHGLVCGLWDSTAKISNCYNANGPIKSVNDGTVTLTNCYETETSVRGTAELRTKENMKGSDVLTNADKMSKLGSAFVLTDDSSLDDYYIYLPAGTFFEEEYSVNCFDTFFVALNNSDVINSAGIMTRGAYISFNEIPDATKIVIPSDVYDFVRFGTMLELAANDTYYGDRINVITKTLDSQPENAVNYIYITDMHYSSSYFLTESLKNQIKLIVKTANEDDSIDFVCIGGDSINGAEGKERNLKLLNEIYTPLLDCQKPVFIIQGNHDDGAYQQGSIDISQMFSFKDWRANIINKYVNRTLDNGTEVKVVNNSNDDNPKYYYYDLKDKNTRVVILDCIDYDMTYDENGVITGLEVIDETQPENNHKRYKTGYTYAGYSKEQLKWLAEEALGKLPEGYDAIFFSHMGIDEQTSASSLLQENSEKLRAIIAAYQNKTDYTNKAFDIKVDYSATKGKIRSFQFGHTHYERRYYSPDIDLIQINTGTANGLNKTGRSLYSETEAWFDVMSVTNDYVYKMGVGKASTSKLYYFNKTMMGDLTGDAVVDICDLVALSNVDIGVSPMTTAADVTRSGAIDDTQYTRIREIIIGTVPEDSGAGSIISNKEDYTPSTVTLTLYDENSYGITWQTKSAPLKPVVQVSKGASFNENDFIEFEATAEKHGSYNSSDNLYVFYVSKAVLTDLDANTQYTYRCYDKNADTSSETFTFTTKAEEISSFKFVHVGDSQQRSESDTDGSGTSTYYKNTMQGVAINDFAPDFIVHSGDIVEWSKYESYWHSMINDNAASFAELPVMALSGNHEVSYRNGESEIYKHFNYYIPEQNVKNGFSFAFDYGNTKFIMLDTNGLTDNKLPTDEYTWLGNVLKENKQTWTIVVMHNPMYSVGAYGSDTSKNAISLALRNQLGDLFASNGVDLVIQGHDHVYSKTYPIGIDGAINNQLTYETIDGVDYCTNANGVIYTMHGPAGDQVRKPQDNVEKEFYETYEGSRVSSWAEVEVDGNLLKVSVYYYNNGTPKLWTTYGIKK